MQPIRTPHSKRNKQDEMEKKKKDDRQDTADHLQPATKERKTTMGPSADQSSYISWLSDLVPPSLLASPCRKQPHGALASPAKTKSRDDLVRHRHEPRSLLKHHTEINKRIKPSAKTTNGIRFQNRLPIRTRISG